MFVNFSLIGSENYASTYVINSHHFWNDVESSNKSLLVCNYAEINQRVMKNASATFNYFVN